MTSMQATRRVLGRGGMAAFLVCALMAWGALNAPAAAAQTWFVRAAGGATGDGSMQAPFGTLAAVQQAAGPGDTITVLPSPSGTPPLDGGIALKPRQKLVGAGPPVSGISGSSPAPRIANSSAARNSGDAVVLADESEVSNIAVVASNRGGIYGSDVRNVSVRDNDLSATNASCTTGFVVQPFTLPSGLPGIGVPFSSGLSNGWATIMVDAAHLTTNVSISGNYVHDAACADGIDVRASQTASLNVQISQNTVTRIHQDPSKMSLLAIGLQATGASSLVGDVNNNTETYIGTAYVGDLGNADSEGLFSNTAGHSHLIERADGNTFAHGLGHLSANCIEAAASNGGPTHDVTITNSTCNYVVGDIIEAANLSPDATMTMNIDHVLAAHSTYPAALPQAAVLPGDDGDCLLEVASGSGSRTSVNINHSQFTDCAADGLGVASDVVSGNGGPVTALSFNIENSKITANQLSNLRVINGTGITALDGRVQNTDLSQSPGTPVIVEQRLGYTTNAHLDLGGGALSSNGHNCIYGGTLTDATTRNYSVDAKQDWWGNPGGPAPGRTLAIGGTLTHDSPLSAATCGPTTPTGPTSSALASAAPASTLGQPPGQRSNRLCTSVRHFRVKIRSRYRKRVLRATVLIRGRRVARLGPRHLRAGIDFTGQASGPIAVQIRMRLRDRRVVTDTRHYRLCTVRRSPV